MTENVCKYNFITVWKDMHEVRIITLYVIDISLWPCITSKAEDRPI